MAATTSIPPPLQGPNEKDKKYDRQLRLWAASGQRALEKSHILLFIPKATSKGSSSSVAGIETLKNLVLPGIGAFTIADTARVTEADLGINFLLEGESLGKSRAEECTRLLKELNPDVKGFADTDVCHSSPELSCTLDAVIPFRQAEVLRRITRRAFATLSRVSRKDCGHSSFSANQ